MYVHVTRDAMHRLERAIKPAIADVDDARIVPVKHFNECRHVFENMRVNIDLMDSFKRRRRFLLCAASHLADENNQQERRELLQNAAEHQTEDKVAAGGFKGWYEGTLKEKVELAGW